jgi:hypothetical protein
MGDRPLIHDAFLPEFGRYIPFRFSSPTLVNGANAALCLPIIGVCTALFNFADVDA